MFPEEKGSSDEEEGEEEGEVTRDGTLLASEPARPLYVYSFVQGRGSFLLTNFFVVVEILPLSIR